MTELLLDDMFEGGPEVEETISFSSALERAELDALDEEAFEILDARIQEAKDNGDIDALKEMSFQAAMAACRCDHLDDFMFQNQDAFDMANSALADVAGRQQADNDGFSMRRMFENIRKEREAKKDGKKNAKKGIFFRR